MVEGVDVDQDALYDEYRTHTLWMFYCSLGAKLIKNLHSRIACGLKNAKSGETSIVFGY